MFQENPVGPENPICLNSMTVAGWHAVHREAVRTGCYAMLHGPRYGTKRCLNVDWDRMANTLCFLHDRVFGPYEAHTCEKRFRNLRNDTWRHRSSPGDSISTVVLFRAT